MGFVQEPLDLLGSELADLVPAEHGDDVFADVEFIPLRGARAVTLPHYISKPLLEERAERHAIGRERQSVLDVIGCGDELRCDILARLAVQHLSLARFNADGGAPQIVTLALVDATFVIPAA